MPYSDPCRVHLYCQIFGPNKVCAQHNSQRKMSEKNFNVNVAVDLFTNLHAVANGGHDLNLDYHHGNF